MYAEYCRRAGQSWPSSPPASRLSRHLISAKAPPPSRSVRAGTSDTRPRFLNLGPRVVRVAVHGGPVIVPLNVSGVPAIGHDVFGYPLVSRLLRLLPQQSDGRIGRALERLELAPERDRHGRRAVRKLP